MRGGFSDAVQGYIIDSYYSLDANPNRLAATFSNILTGGAKSAFRVCHLAYLITGLENKKTDGRFK